jgi:hypothetical protein
MADYKTALERQRLLKTGNLAGRAVDLVDWKQFKSDRLDAARETVTQTAKVDGKRWKMNRSDLGKVGQPGWRFVPLWAPAHIMKPILGCDVFVIAVPEASNG